MVKIMEYPKKNGWFEGKTHYFRKHPYGFFVHTIYIYIYTDSGPLEKKKSWKPEILGAILENASLSKLPIWVDDYLAGVRSL